MSTETINLQIPAGTWAVDPVHSVLHFAITHNGIATFRSGFDDYSATLTGGEAPKLEGSVEVAGIDIDEEMLKGHVLSPDFFDAEKFPQLKFRSTELSIDDDDSVRLSGELEIRGETRPIQAVGRYAAIGEDLGGNQRIGFSLEAAVDRREFGLNWNADLPNGGKALEFEVAINVELEFVPEEA